MAVDAHHLLLSHPPQHFSNTELMMMNNNNNTTMEPITGGFCNNIQTSYGLVSPSFLHMYGDTVHTIPTIADSFTNYYADATNLPLPTRKRSRDSNYHHHLQNSILSSSCCVNSATTTSTFPFLGQDIDHISSHINQHQHEIDRFISLNMERMKFEIDGKRKRQARTTMEEALTEHGVLVKKLRVKEEERQKIGKINHALEERVKSLSMENQIWRDLAQTNEATANHLRTNLEHVLAQVKDPGAGLDNEDHAESCSGGKAHDKAGRMCRNCGEEESSVLLLPCRHLCLCGVCGSNIHTCPICRSPKNASVDVNMSS